MNTRWAVLVIPKKPYTRVILEINKDLFNLLSLKFSSIARNRHFATLAMDAVSFLRDSPFTRCKHGIPISI